nr:hypothetical protein [uncultured Devosia sp.]
MPLFNLRLRRPLASAALAGALILAPVATFAQDRLDLRIVMSGHSLTDPIPVPLRALAIQAGASPDVVIDGSTIPGSPMEWRWDNPATPNAKTDIANYDLMVLTERVPLSNTLPYHNSTTSALAWLDNAYRHGAGGKGAETLLYASWVDIDSGPGAENLYGDEERHIPWRERMPLEFARWLEIADYVNGNLPDGAQPMRVIPATLVFAAAYDDIIAGKAPGFTDISELFLDTIHVNGKGAYLAALAHYTVIYDLDPRGMSNDVGLPETVTREQAAWMQDVVWEVIQTYRSLDDRRRSASLSSESFQACIWQNLRHAAPSCG